MEEVKQYHTNLAVASYYKKAYDKVHRDWILRVMSRLAFQKK